MLAVPARRRDNQIPGSWSAYKSALADQVLITNQKLGMGAEARIVVTDDVAGYVAEAIIQAARQAQQRKAHASTVLAGGMSFCDIYRKLASSDLDWANMEWYFGDERQVPLDDGRSNYRMAAELLSSVWEQGKVYPLTGSDEYDQLVRVYLDRNNLFDITLLGVGKDGHTASLFPSGRHIWEGTSRHVVDAEAGLEPLVRRRTLTPKALNASGLVIMVATGEGKSEIVAELADDQERHYPASLIQPVGNKLLVVDSAAGSLLTTQSIIYKNISRE